MIFTTQCPSFNIFPINTVLPYVDWYIGLGYLLAIDLRIILVWIKLGAASLAIKYIPVNNLNLQIELKCVTVDTHWKEIIALVQFITITPGIKLNTVSREKFLQISQIKLLRYFMWYHAEIRILVERISASLLMFLVTVVINLVWYITHIPSRLCHVHLSIPRPRQTPSAFVSICYMNTHWLHSNWYIGLVWWLGSCLSK